MVEFSTDQTKEYTSRFEERIRLSASKFRVKDLEGICLPPYVDCTECWQEDKYCVGLEWDKTWADIEANPD